MPCSDKPTERPVDGREADAHTVVAEQRVDLLRGGVVAGGKGAEHCDALPRGPEAPLREQALVVRLPGLGHANTIPGGENKNHSHIARSGVPGLRRGRRLGRRADERRRVLLSARVRCGGGAAGLRPRSQPHAPGRRAARSRGDARRRPGAPRGRSRAARSAAASSRSSRTLRETASTSSTCSTHPGSTAWRTAMSTSGSTRFGTPCSSSGSPTSSAVRTKPRTGKAVAQPRPRLRAGARRLCAPRDRHEPCGLRLPRGSVWARADRDHREQPGGRASATGSRARRRRRPRDRRDDGLRRAARVGARGRGGRSRGGRADRRAQPDRRAHRE